MGFQDNSGDIFLDAVLTDEGRERLARNDGSFAITRWRPADDEIDYRFWNELTGSDSKDVKILDTPIFEAFSNEIVALRYPMVTIKNARLQYMPQITSNPNSVVLQAQTDSVGGGVDVTVSQNVAKSQTILPPEVIDNNYQVEVDNDLIFVSGEVPVSITPFATARYMIPSTGRTSSGGTSVGFNVRVQTLTSQIFDILVGPATPNVPRVITTNILVTGQQSGLNVIIPTSITEFLG